MPQYEGKDLKICLCNENFDPSIEQLLGWADSVLQHKDISVVLDFTDEKTLELVEKFGEIAERGDQILFPERGQILGEITYYDTEEHY